MLTRGFTVTEVWRRGLCARRLEIPTYGRPDGFDFGLSPSAQDDTEADFTPILKQRRTYLLTYNAETNESLLQWEKVAAGG